MKKMLLIALLALCQIFTAAGVDRQEFARPNIVLIMVDDMGWSDIGCYGAEIQTPNLDSLAGSGIRFRQFYNTSKCFPSRAALLTGVYPQQNGYDSSSHNPLRNSTTIGEILRSAGYHTYVSGKHHGKDNLFERGFDRYYGLRDGACNHFNPGRKRAGEPEPARKGYDRIWADDALLFDTRDTAYQSYFPTNFYSTDFFTAKANDFIAEWQQQDTGRPFFLYLSYTAPHDPLHAWPDDIAKYDDVYEVGYEAIRTNRYARQLDMGLINSGQYVLSPPQYQNWNSLSAGEQADQAKRMQVYAAMIDRVDQKIGEVIQQLKDYGVFDNTLILFCSDNGSSAENVNIGTGEIGELDRYSSLQRHWANVGNTPFRYYKNDSEEGGIRTPLIAHWPDGIVNPGRFADKKGHLIDFMATFMDLSGAEYPRKIDGEAVTPLQGESFADVLFDEPVTPRSALYFEWRRGRAVIDGDYKLVSRNKGNTWRLYNLATDATELHDLSAVDRQRFTALRSQYNTWLEAVKDNVLDGAHSNEAFVTRHFTATDSDSSLKIEAENAATIRAEVKDNRPSASGGEFINFNPNDPPDYIEWNIVVPESGGYAIEFTYALDDAAGRTLDVTVNASPLYNDHLFPDTGSWDNFAPAVTLTNIPLQAGTNTLRVATAVNVDGPNLDFITITRNRPRLDSDS